MALLFVMLSGCDRGPSMFDRLGMSDPWRTDAAPVKVLLGHTRYVIPANCFMAPIDARQMVDGYAVQDGILLTFLWPTGECRTRENLEKFRVAGFGSTVSMLMLPYRNVDRVTLLNRHLLIRIEMIRFTGLESNVPPPDMSDGDEDVWHVKRRPGDTSSPVKIRADHARSYIMFCAVKPEDNSVESGCSLEFIQENTMKMSFSPALSSKPAAVYELGNKKLRSFRVKREQNK